MCQLNCNGSFGGLSFEYSHRKILLSLNLLFWLIWKTLLVCKRYNFANFTFWTIYTKCIKPYKFINIISYNNNPNSFLKYCPIICNFKIHWKQSPGTLNYYNKNINSKKCLLYMYVLCLIFSKKKKYINVHQILKENPKNTFVFTRSASISMCVYMFCFQGSQGKLTPWQP